MMFVYVTFANIQEAEKIIASLLEQKLIACATFSEKESRYIWEGKIAQEKEIIAFCKTNTQKLSQLQAEIIKQHSYSIPCIIAIPAQANEWYENWLEETLTV